MFFLQVNMLDTGHQYIVETMRSAISSVSRDRPSIEKKIITQPLDHFDDNEKRIWSMGYFERLDFWKPNGPIYLFMWGEGPMSPAALEIGTLYELALETNGAMFSSEHRYYGESMPLNVTGTSDLKFLSSRQALADAANLLKMIKSDPKFALSNVVVVGGSYAGNLAAWMRLLYPELITAAIASSAPVLAKVDFYKYLETVSDDFKQYGTLDCMDKIEKAFKHYDDSFKTPEGIELLKKEEYICDDTDFTRPENKQLFFSDRIGPFMGLAQYGTPNTIKEHCEDVLKGKTMKFFKKNIGLNFWQKKHYCDTYDFDEEIAGIKNNDQYFSWTYQTCTEFGYYKTTSSKKHPFTHNIPTDFYYKQCAMLFGPEYNEESIKKAVEKTNNFYKGLELNVTNVVFVNGGMDPWMRLGVTKDISDDSPAIVIPNSSHCLDLFSDTDTDPEELKKARNNIKKLIKSWIGVHKNRKNYINK